MALLRKLWHRGVCEVVDLHHRLCRLHSGADAEIGRCSFDGLGLGRSASSRAWLERKLTRPEINPLNITNHEKQEEKSRAH